MEALNERQLEALSTLDGPLLMLAGAGTGKTRALTARVAHIVHTQNAKPNEILAVTFTNKAAREMKQRLGLHVGSLVENMPWIGTFHSLSVKLLRRHAELVGLKTNFTIIDTDDQIRLLKQLVKAENIDEKKWPIKNLAFHIDSWKNRAFTPDKIPEAEHTFYNGRGSEFYTLYQERLRILNGADFGDLMLHVVQIFQKNPDVLKKYQKWFRYILVDEYQDTNIAQYFWLRLLAAGHKNICCVGDDDQAIYGWRGAEVGNILKFETDFPGAKIIRLEQNYRSTPQILDTASNLISENQSRLGKTLFTKGSDGPRVRLIGHWDGDEEARWIGEEIESYEKGTRGYSPIPLDKQAVLVRTSFQMRALEDRFLNIGLSYKIIGGPRFYERQEIRDAIAYFRITTNFDDSMALERIINVPKRGIGEKAMRYLNISSRNKNISLLESAKLAVAEGTLPTKQTSNLEKLIKNIERWNFMNRADEISQVDMAEMILEESGYTELWMNDLSPTAPGRLENLKELVKAIQEFNNLQGFLEHVSLVMENEQERNVPQVSIMTLHAAKGLEFSVVFLPGWEDGLFPSQRSMDESGQKGLEEERRLAYVGITRTELHCNISFAANRRFYNQWQSSPPSRFIDNLPRKNVEVLTPPSLISGNLNAFEPSSVSNSCNNISVFDETDKFNTKINSQNMKSSKYIAPGWQRLNQNKTDMTAFKPYKSVANDMSPPDFEIGDQVFHQKFGYGIVHETEADTVIVAFKKAGIKKVKSNFLLDKDNFP